jgi:hypothetical protein
MNDDVARAEAEARQARRLADTFPDDRGYRDQAYAAERKLSKLRALDDFASEQRDDNRLAVIEQRLDAIEQQLADFDRRVDRRVAGALSDLLADIETKFAVPLGELLRKELGALERKLAEVQTLLRATPSEIEPLELPSLRETRRTN